MASIKFIMRGDCLFNIFVAIITPFNSDLTIDFLSFKKIVDKLISEGVDGIIVGGTTGEAPTLSDKEKKHLYEYASLLIDGRCKLYLGIGNNDTVKTLDFMDTIKDIECDGYLVVVPYYNKPSQKGLYTHFSLIASKTLKEIWIYNIPSRCGIGIDFETIEKLSKLPNIKGIKEASDNFNLMEMIKEKTDLLVFIGEDHLICEAKRRNLDGIISVAGHLFLPEMKRLCDDEMLEIIYRNRFRALFYEPNPVMIKAILAKMGYIKPYLRLPHIPLDDNDVDGYYKIIVGDKK